MTKHTGKFVAYYRVSTKRQSESGLGLDAQKAAVAEYLNGGDWELIGEFTEVESGRKVDRPQIEEALKLCKKEGATLIVAKLDRLARNLMFIATLMESKVEFICCDLPSANKFTIHVLAAVAEHEREKIAERTRAALKAAKKRGVILGNPNVASVAALGGAVIRKRAEQHSANIMPIIVEIQAAGVSSYRGIARALTARGLKTLRNAEWGPQQVKNVMSLSEEIQPKSNKKA